MHIADGVLMTWLRRRNGCARVITERFQAGPEHSVSLSKFSADANGPRLAPQSIAGMGPSLGKPRQMQVASAIYLLRAHMLLAAVLLPNAASSRHLTELQQSHAIVSMKHQLSQAEREVCTASCVAFC